jgi:cysteinyl-tRNA synthetase
METADRRVRQLRRRVAEWARAETDGEAVESDAAKAFDGRFREAIANDLDLPSAVVVVNELASSSDVTDAAKYALLRSWDEVLGLDLDREARTAWEPTDHMKSLMDERDRARAVKDFAASDRLRDDLLAMGVEVMDTPDGTRVRPRD